MLYTLHDIEGLRPPFILHIRSHIASCTMFRLERSVIFLHNEFSHIIDHILISLHLILRVERLIDDEVEVSFESMSIYT